MTVPEAAADAAARNLFGGLTRTKWEDIGPLSRRAYHEMARDALEAAAPFMPTSGAVVDLLAMCDKADKDPGSMYGKLTTYEIREALNPYRKEGGE